MILHKPFKPYLDEVTGKIFYHDGNHNFYDERFYALVKPLRKTLEERFNIPTDELKPIRKRIQNHIDTVYYLGKLYDNKFDFSEHDTSKLFDEFEDIIYINMQKFQTADIFLDKDGYENKNLTWAYKVAIKHHKITNPHHPEFWETDINLMPDLNIVEMVSDWHAMSLEQLFTDANIPQSNTNNYYKNKAQNKYNFNSNQEKLITDVIKFLESKTDKKAIDNIWQSCK